MLGVLGGMGPLATADFLQKFVKATPAETDQDHPEVVIFSNSKIPDRVGPILGKSTVSPLPGLIDSAQRLENFGAQLIAMPCHTAHYWYTQIASAVTVPFLHIADVTCEEIVRSATERKPTVGVLATRATLHAQIYQHRFRSFGISYLLPEPDDLERIVLPAIAAVKRESLAQAGQLLAVAAERMMQKGAGLVVLACTELPAVLEHTDSDVRGCCIDTTEILARACVSALGFKRRSAPGTA